MTANQIAYWEMQEKKRANQAQEALKGREAYVKEFLAPFEAANLTKQVSERSASQFEKVTKGLKNIFSVPSALFGLGGKD